MAGGHAGQVDILIPFVLLAVFVGCLVNTALAYLPKKTFHPPYTVVMLILGFVIHAITHNIGAGLMWDSVQAWNQTHPHTILFVLLPPLLFESAFNMHFHVFHRVSASSLLMAGPGVMLALVMTGLFIYYGFGSYGWSWPESFMVASVLSATDPVAVVAVLQTLGAPEKLSILIEGESLLNDGSAFVMFLIFQKIIAGGFTVAEGVGMLFQLALGGAVWGWFVALVTFTWLQVLWNDSCTEIGLMLLAVFGSFFMAESLFHFSGVLTVVCFGLYMAHGGKFAITREVEHSHHAVWSHVAFQCNSFIFALSGVLIYGQTVLQSGDLFSALNWGLLLALYVVLHVVRALVILILWPLLTRLGYGITWKEAVICVYGGLRGAVGLALGLLVSLDDHISAQNKLLINFHISGIVLLTLLVNGTTAGWLYKKLDVYPKNKFRPVLTQRALANLHGDLEEVVEEFREDWFYSGARWDVVMDLVPDLSAVKIVDGQMNVDMKSVSQVFVASHLDNFSIVRGGNGGNSSSTSIMCGGAAEGDDVRSFALNTPNAAAAGASPRRATLLASTPMNESAVRMHMSRRPSTRALSIDEKHEGGIGGPILVDTVAEESADAVQIEMVEAGGGTGAGGGGGGDDDSTPAADAAAAGGTRPRTHSYTPMARHHLAESSQFVPAVNSAVVLEQQAGCGASERRSETYHVILDSLKAFYTKQYEERRLSARPLNHLSEAADTALDLVEEAGSSPLHAMWAFIEQDLVIPRKLMDYSDHGLFGHVCTSRLFKVIRYEVELLRTFITGCVVVTEELWEHDNPNISDSDEEDVHAYGAAAGEELVGAAAVAIEENGGDAAEEEKAGDGDATADATADETADETADGTATADADATAAAAAEDEGDDELFASAAAQEGSTQAQESASMRRTSTAATSSRGGGSRGPRWRPPRVRQDSITAMKDRMSGKMGRAMDKAKARADKGRVRALASRGETPRSPSSASSPAGWSEVELVKGLVELTVPARRRLEALELHYPKTVCVVQTVLAANALMQEKLEMIEEYFESGLLDASTRQQLAGLLDHRHHEIKRYHPHPKILKHNHGDDSSSSKKRGSGGLSSKSAARRREQAAASQEQV